MAEVTRPYDWDEDQTANDELLGMFLEFEAASYHAEEASYSRYEIRKAMPPDIFYKIPIIRNSPYIGYILMRSNRVLLRKHAEWHESRADEITSKYLSQD